MLDIVHKVFEEQVAVWFAVVFALGSGWLATRLHLAQKKLKESTAALFRCEEDLQRQQQLFSESLESLSRMRALVAAQAAAAAKGLEITELSHQEMARVLSIASSIGAEVSRLRSAAASLLFSAISQSGVKKRFKKELSGSELTVEWLQEFSPYPVKDGVVHFPLTGTGSTIQLGPAGLFVDGDFITGLKDKMSFLAVVSILKLPFWGHPAMPVSGPATATTEDHEEKTSDPGTSKAEDRGDAASESDSPSQESVGGSVL